MCVDRIVLAPLHPVAGGALAIPALLPVEESEHNPIQGGPGALVNCAAWARALSEIRGLARPPVLVGLCCCLTLPDRPVQLAPGCYLGTVPPQSVSVSRPPCAPKSRVSREPPSVSGGSAGALRLRSLVCP